MRVLSFNTSTVMEGGMVARSRGSAPLIASTFRSRWRRVPLTSQTRPRCLSDQAATGCFRRRRSPGDIADMDRAPVAIGDDHLVIVGGFLNLVVRRDGRGDIIALNVPLGASMLAWLRTVRTSSSAYPGCAGGRSIRTRTAASVAVQEDLADARNLRHLLAEDIVGVVVDLVERQDVGIDAHDENRRVGRIVL